jgi:hypothetical protein
VIIPGGRPPRAALHRGTFVGLEVLLLAVAATNGGTAVATLARLNDFRQAVSGQRHDAPEEFVCTPTVQNGALRQARPNLRYLTGIKTYRNKKDRRVSLNLPPSRSGTIPPFARSSP